MKINLAVKLIGTSLLMLSVLISCSQESSTPSMNISSDVARVAAVPAESGRFFKKAGVKSVGFSRIRNYFGQRSMLDFTISICTIRFNSIEER